MNILDKSGFNIVTIIVVLHGFKIIAILVLNICY